MDVTITNNLKKDEPDDDIMVGDNAMSVERGASFLMGYDPYQDPEKPKPKSSIGDAPMGEKPTENPLVGDHLKLHSGNDKKDTTAGVDTLIAAASNLGPNPLGLNPFGLDQAELDAISLDPLGFGAKKDSVSVSVKKTEKAEAPKEAKKPEEILLSRIYSLSDPAFPQSMIIYGSSFFESSMALKETVVDSMPALNKEVDDEPIGLAPADDEPIGLAPVDDGPLGLMPSDDEPQEAPASDKKNETKAPDGVDPLMALLLAGGNPFGDSSKKPAPDLSFGKEALKPKHFEPMKASGPRTNAENVKTNNPLGDNPFGKEVVPDFSMGKEALKPKKYVPKKSYDSAETTVDKQEEKKSDHSLENDDWDE